MNKERGTVSAIERSDGGELLRSIIEGTVNVTGERFFQTLVHKLAETLNVSYVFIAEFNPEKTRASIVAMWENDHFGREEEFALANTPCEAVVAGKKCVYASDVKNLFPRDTWLAEIGAEGYIATPLIDAGGQVMGHLAVIDTRPIEWQERDLYVFDIFAIRAAAELDRQRARMELRHNQEWLNTILSSVMDAVVVLDASRNVMIFNHAAERIFQVPRSGMQSRSLDRLLSPALLQAITGFINRTETGKRLSDQTFLPDGLKALRGNGREFTVEATLSTLNINNNSYYILIMRDVDERIRNNMLLNRLKEQTSYYMKAMDEGNDPQTMIVGSKVMEELMSRIRQVAMTDTSVLLLGETGTGKELIAHTLHRLSHRRDKILIKVNCAALPADLVESELFGHEKGSFSGAYTQRKGRFELADGGTLFLDEVGELSLASQAKLLRVLQEKEFERVGGSATIRVDVRVIAATNRDLGEMVSCGKFRVDLFYRLNVFPVMVPSLRDRLDDIPQLCKHFLGIMERKLGKRLTGISPDALRRMYRYPWPGNVRELQNVIERAAILATSPILDVDKLLPPDKTVATRTSGSGTATLCEVERDHIELALELVNWVVEGKNGAAALLGMNPSTLRYRMQKLGIRRPQHAAPQSVPSGTLSSGRDFQED